MFDDDEGSAAVDEFAEGCEELGYVVEVEAGGGLVEDVEDAGGLGRFGGGVGGASLAEVGGEFDALGFSAGEGGGGLAEAEVAEAYFIEDGEFVEEAGDSDEETESFLDGEVEHVVDAFALVVDAEDFGLVAGAVAVFAGEFDIGEELHFDSDGAVALTGFAAAAGDVEGEVSGGEG